MEFKPLIDTSVVNKKQEVVNINAFCRHACARLGLDNLTGYRLLQLIGSHVHEVNNEITLIQEEVAFYGSANGKK